MSSVSARWWWGVALIAASLGACTKANPSASCANGACSDPSFPFCDQDGVIDGTPNACIAVTCTAGDFGACDGSNELTCNATGDGFDESPCDSGCSAAANGCNGCTPDSTRCVAAGVEHCGDDGAVTATDPCTAGCVDDPAPHCAYLEPRYLPDICDMPATTDTHAFNNNEMFDTDLDANCDGGIVTQAGAPSICVVRAKTITVASTATLTVLASTNAQNFNGGRVLALVADDALTVDGVIDAGAKGRVSGPGGGLLASGTAPSGTNGGGGAGFRTAGGAGGSVTSAGGAANDGTEMPDPALLTSLTGGPSAIGGGGGGAVLLIACRGSVSIAGTLASGGGAGFGGRFDPKFSLTSGGAGGGAGGYLVLEGLGISVTGSVFANGGGGGEGAAHTDVVQIGSDPGIGSTGADGSLSDSVAGAGGSADAGGGFGGDGGIGTHSAKPGGMPSSTAQGAAGGGGGGSVGFVQTYTPAGVTPSLTPAHASPTAQPNANVSTR